MEQHRRDVRVLLVDDHPVARAAIARMLADDERLDLIGQAADGVEAIRVLTEHRADAVLMDVSMPAMDGIEATRAITCLWPRVVVVGLSADDPGDTARRRLADAGAAGFVSKTAGVDGIIDALLRLVDAPCPAGGGMA